MTDPDQRATIDRLLSEGKPLEAAHELALLWARDPSSAAFIASRFKTIGSSMPLVPCRVAFERSFTLEPLVPVCRAAALVSGIDLTVHLGPFNAYTQEMLDARSALYAFEPDVVVLAALTSDVAPELWSGSSRALALEETVQRVIGHYTQLVAAFRATSQAHLIVHLLELPVYPSLGILDAQTADGQSAAILQINDGLRQMARRHSGVHVLDYDALIARFGHLHWRDEVKWQVARMPIKAAFHRHLAREWLRFLHPITGKIAKVVAVDLDNTIWGGVIGEDGLAGIKLGKEYPGLAYRSLQQTLRELKDRGLLLAVCSKNNPGDVEEVFGRHPEMLLTLDDFAAVKINWAAKSDNLRAISAELNVGLDAVAFVDDNPVERQQVRSALPEVQIVELPDDPLQYADTLRSFPPFERLTLSQEDRDRSRYYASRKKVMELASSAPTKEEFYRELQQRVIIEPVNDLTLARAAQLAQKTNQFNLTTRRSSEQQIEQSIRDAHWRTYTIRVIDRYADNGLVGLALTRDENETCHLEEFLLSCRVISRGVETALLAQVVRDARARGVHLVEGTFIPTKKNQPAVNFLGDHGFTLFENQQDRSIWRLDLRRGDVPWPAWIQLAGDEALAR